MTEPRSSCALCGGDGHTQSACPWREQEAQRVAADLAANFDKAHQRNNEAFFASMQRQINDHTGASA